MGNETNLGIKKSKEMKNKHILQQEKENTETLDYKSLRRKVKEKRKVSQEKDSNCLSKEDLEESLNASYLAQYQYKK